MKLMIRAHDLGVKGENQVVLAVHSNGLDGIQLVAYKCTDDVKYEAGAITPDRAKEIGDTLNSGGVMESDLSARLEGPRTGLPRRPLSIRASTNS